MVRMSFARGDEVRFLHAPLLVPWLNGYNSTLSRCEMPVRIRSGPLTEKVVNTAT